MEEERGLRSTASFSAEALLRWLRAFRHSLTQAWRRMADCRRDQHRETVDCELGVLKLRCLDCGHRTTLGFVFLHVSNKLHPYFPWERTDDA